MSKFENGKFYVFNIGKYKKDMKKRIKKAKEEDKKEIKKNLQDGLNGFAKELMERKYTFSIMNSNIGIYTDNFGSNILIYPEWCDVVTLEEYKQIMERKVVK